MKLCLVGGFLGSGKTTAILNAGKMLLSKNIPVAVITNDQGAQLVDTAFTSSVNIPHTEIRNGCFCCNYEQFHSAIQFLGSTIRPDIIFAEAVGSCVDLVATVVKPMQQLDPGANVVFSVFADGPVLLALLEGRSSFINEDVRYIYKKQLEETSILIVNKSDCLTDYEIRIIQSIVESEYPGKAILFQDSRNEASVQGWLDTLIEDKPGRILASLHIDYEKYAAGEAALAWLDAFITIHSRNNAVQKSYEFIDEIVDAISFKQLPIGHLKFFLQSGDWQQKISYTAGNNATNKRWTNKIVANHATLLVNARVETSPDVLKKIFFQAITKMEKSGCHFEVLKCSAFQPGYPKPTYRIP